MKPTNQQCVRCGAKLPPDHRAERPCPRCLLGLGLQISEPPPAMDGEPSGASAPLTSKELALLFPTLEIFEVIGEGGMGVVYRARHTDLDRPVALKVLRPPTGPEGEDDPAFAERFTREARALAKLSHPNIVQVHDFGQAGPHYYLIMELVEGTNLRQLMAGGTLDPVRALEIVAQVSGALHYAHGIGVVHRDVKPENILLDANGRVRIVDFGLAKMTRAEESALRLTHTRQAMGTPQYMAPEQIERPLEVDHRADIYSLGVVFYELLTGELPIGRFAAPSHKVQVDVRLDDVVLRSLEKEPELRYQSVSEVQTDINKVRSRPRHRGTERSDRKRRYRVGKRNARKRRSTSLWAWGLVAVFAITCLPISCAAMFLMGSNQPKVVTEAIEAESAPSPRPQGVRGQTQTKDLEQALTPEEIYDIIGEDQ